MNWIESSAYDGRYAVVLMSDVSVYAKGPARPAGGAGALAMLLGPDAPLVFEPALRVTSVRHTYDFYKPDVYSEYPTVNGKASIKSFLTQLDTCYELFLQKLKAHGEEWIEKLFDFDYFCFHTPFSKQV